MYFANSLNNSNQFPFLLSIRVSKYFSTRVSREISISSQNTPITRRIGSCTKSVNTYIRQRKGDAATISAILQSSSDLPSELIVGNRSEMREGIEDRRK